MRIGIYNPRVGFAESGGTETFLREMMRRFADRHEVTCYTGEGKLLEEIRTMNVRVEQLPLVRKEDAWNERMSSMTPLLPAEIESLTMYRSARKLGVFTQMAEDVDVLSTHYYLDNLLVSRHVPIPTLFRFPGIKGPSIRWNLMKRYARPDLYLSNSKSTAERLWEWLEVETAGVVYAGVDTERFNPEVSPAFDAGEDVAILYVGRLDEGKGLKELVDAHAALADRTTMYLVGGGTLEDQLRERAKQQGTAGAVEFVGRVPNEEIPGYYTAADVFCLPSHHESFGIVNIEAMACGVPVVTTRIDAIKEYATDEENAILVDIGDSDALQSALERLVDSKQLRERLGGVGQRTAKRFSWDSQAEKLECYYERIVTSDFD